VIYSEVDEAFFGPVEAGRLDKEFQINLVSSLYFPEHLDTLLEGIGTWSGEFTETQRSRVRVSYIGGDTDLFKSVADRRIPAIEREALGFVPLSWLAARCRRAAVNAYVVHREASTTSCWSYWPVAGRSSSQTVPRALLLTCRICSSAGARVPSPWAMKM
jgi:hypothetical protein